MLQTPNYKLNIYEGEDWLNPLDVENYNSRIIDSQMKNNEQVGAANSEQIINQSAEIQKAKQDISGLKVTTNEHSQTIGNLQALVNKQTGEIAEVGADYSALAQSLQTEISSREQGDVALQTAINGLNTSTNALNGEVEGIKEDISNLEDEVSGLAGGLTIANNTNDIVLPFTDIIKIMSIGNGKSLYAVTGSYTDITNPKRVELNKKCYGIYTGMTSAFRPLFLNEPLTFNFLELYMNENSDGENTYYQSNFKVITGMFAIFIYNDVDINNLPNKNIELIANSLRFI